MSSETRNQGWKDNLLAWESSGGQAPQQKDRLWDRLQTRLQPRTTPGRTYLLRAAALLLPLIGGWLLWKSEVTRPVTPPAAPPSLQTGQPAARIHLETIGQKKAGIEVAARRAVLPVQPWRTDTIVPQQAIPDTPAEDTGTYLAAAPSRVAQPLLLPKQPDVKKKLKIVHMNEWNAPPPPTYAAQKDRPPVGIIAEPEDMPVGPSIWPGKNKNRTLSASRN